ncbi:MAG: DUF2293 domain-containing protein [Salinivirgaceae bacterium]|nr:DUF2293 domain-containing protein [Salinivirgaceae bacterium]
MANTSQNIFIAKKQKLRCSNCGNSIPIEHAFVAESEDSKGTCFACSPFVNYTLLPPGNVALTRRSKKHSELCGVLFAWNQRRKRYERKGQYVERTAIIKAEEECAADEATRAIKNEKAAVIRAAKDQAYILEFGAAIRAYYPNCPAQREYEIAKHTCEKYSGRVGRSARAKQFDTKMIDLAVVAHIRHTETNYDSQFGKGKGKKEIRSDLSSSIKRIINSWK